MTTESNRYLIFSMDSHVGPSAKQLRPYCEGAHLQLFDEYYEQIERRKGWPLIAMATDVPPEIDDLIYEHSRHVGVDDPHDRLRNMDADFTAVELLFHGAGANSKEYRPIPFVTSPDLTLQRLGKRIYNRWLADFVSVAPDRLIGVAEVPFWDIGQFVEEVEWAAENGLRSVIFPAPRHGLPTYEQDLWDPLWSAVVDTNSSLQCHSGIASNDFTGPYARALFWSEVHFWSRRSLPVLTLGGVFQRHPGLRVCYNEQRAHWLPDYLTELEAIYWSPYNRPLRSHITKSPREFWRDNCYIGGSFAAHFEVARRHEVGIESVTWGRDYPHVEGTWPHTLAALRSAFWDVPEDETRMMLGLNACRLYGVDPSSLDHYVSQIGPTVEQIHTPIEAYPTDSLCHGFRDYGAWGTNTFTPPAGLPGI